MLKDKRIFVFEDDAFNLAVMSVPLRREGAKVFFARWGEDAVKNLQRSMPVDIILLDLMYPDKTTGYDIFDKIRSIPEFESIPIIAVTAADPDTELPKVFHKGFTGFISKPISKYFTKYVAQAIGGKPVWEAE